MVGSSAPPPEAARLQFRLQERRVTTLGLRGAAGRGARVLRRRLFLPRAEFEGLLLRERRLLDGLAAGDGVRRRHSGASGGQCKGYRQN
jgi:hypothetical protein